LYLDLFQLHGYERDKEYSPSFAAAADFAAWFVDLSPGGGRHFIKASLDPNLGSISMIAPNTDFVPGDGRESLVERFLAKFVALCTAVHALSDKEVHLALCHLRATGHVCHHPGNAARNLC
jgi:hypothetical protein